MNKWIIVVGSRSVVGKNGGGGWWWRVAWGGGHDGGGSDDDDDDDDDDVKTATAATELALSWSYWSVCWRWGESELCVRLKQPHLTAQSHFIHSFSLSFPLFLSFSLTHTWLCCDDHVECESMEACMMKANKKAFSYYSNMYHSCYISLFLIILFSFTVIHIHTSHLSHHMCLYVKLVWKSLRMRCMVGWLVYNECSECCGHSSSVCYV